MRSYVVFLTTCFLLVLGITACGSSEPVKIESVTLARDDGSGQPGEQVTAFNPGDHIFHATITLNRIETGLKVKLVWIAVDAGGVQNEIIDQVDMDALAVNIINGRVELPTDWPTGSYKLEIYLNDALAQSVEFTVAAQ